MDANYHPDSRADPFAMAVDDMYIASPWSATPPMEDTSADSSGDMSVDVVWEPSQPKSEALGALIEEAKRARKLSHRATWDGGASSLVRDASTSSSFASCSTSMMATPNLHASASSSLPHRPSLPYRSGSRQSHRRHATKPDQTGLWRLMEGVSNELQGRTRKIVQEAEAAAAAAAAQAEPAHHSHSKKHALRAIASSSSSSSGLKTRSSKTSRTGKELVSVEGRVVKEKRLSRDTPPKGGHSNSAPSPPTYPSASKGKGRAIDHDHASMDVDSPVPVAQDDRRRPSMHPSGNAIRSRTTRSDMGPPPVPPSKLAAKASSSATKATSASQSVASFSSTPPLARRVSVEVVDAVRMDITAPDSPARRADPVTTPAPTSRPAARPRTESPNKPTIPSTRGGLGRSSSASSVFASTTGPATSSSTPTTIEPGTSTVSAIDIDLPRSQPASSQRVGAGQARTGPPALGMRRYPTPGSSAPFAPSQTLPTRQKAFKPPIIKTGGGAASGGGTLITSTTNQNGRSGRPDGRPGSDVRQGHRLPTPDWSPSPHGVLVPPRKPGAGVGGAGALGSAGTSGKQQKAGTGVSAQPREGNSSPGTDADSSFGDLSFDADALEAVLQQYDDRGGKG